MEMFILVPIIVGFIAGLILILRICTGDRMDAINTVSAVILILCIMVGGVSIEKFNMAEKYDHVETHTYMSNEYRNMRFPTVRQITTSTRIPKSWSMLGNRVYRVEIRDPISHEVIVIGGER